MEVGYRISRWEDRPLDDTEKEFPINLAHISYDITGELTGRASIKSLFFYTDYKEGSEPTFKISGFLHFEGTYKGKRGTFTAIEQGMDDKGNLDCSGTIIKATGELEGLKGSYNYENEDTVMILDFTF